MLVAKVPEPNVETIIIPPVTSPTKPDRATRLHLEAVNCVTIAVREKAEQHAAMLIDEAIRLMRRSVELSR